MQDPCVLKSPDRTIGAGMAPGGEYGICWRRIGVEQGSSRPVTQELATRIRQLLGGLFGGRAAAPLVPDPLTLPPVPIRSVADLETLPMQQAWLRLEAKRGARRFLSRADIEPGEFLPILSTMGLIEVHYAPLRFRIRLAGTGWRETLGFEATGLWLHDWPSAFQKTVLELAFTTAVTEQRAGRARRHAIVDGVTLQYEAVTIPLAADGETIDMLLAMSAPWRAETPPKIQAHPFL
jgi:hypothetical protein